MKCLSVLISLFTAAQVSAAPVPVKKLTADDIAGRWAACDAEPDPDNSLVQKTATFFPDGQYVYSSVYAGESLFYGYGVWWLNDAGELWVCWRSLGIDPDGSETRDVNQNTMMLGRPTFEKSGLTCQGPDFVLVRLGPCD